MAKEYEYNGVNKKRIVLEYSTAHGEGWHIIEGVSIIDCLNQLDERIMSALVHNVHIKRYEITGMRFYGINNSKPIL